MTPLSTLSGMELRRKALEARGFTVKPLGTYFALYGPTGARLDEETVYKTAESSWMDAPAIESDAALAIAELRKLCHENNWGWRIEETDMIRCMIFRRGLLLNAELAVAFERSDSEVAEAVSHCIVIASARETAK